MGEMKVEERLAALFAKLAQSHGQVMESHVASWRAFAEQFGKDAPAESRWAAFTDDELGMIVSWKQSLDAAVRTGDRRYEPDDSFGEEIEAELDRRSS